MVDITPVAVFGQQQRVGEVNEIKRQIVQKMEQAFGFQARQFKQLIDVSTQLREISTFLDAFKVVGMSKYLKLDCTENPLLYYMSQGMKERAVFETVFQNQQFLVMIFKYDKDSVVE